MHSSKVVTVLGALFTAVAAVPMKRDLIMEVVTEWDIVTEYATETVWVDGTSTWTATVNQQQYTQPAPHSAATTSPAAAPVVVATLPKAPAPIATTTSTKTSVAATTPTTPAYVAPVVPTTSVYVAPAAPTTTSTTSAYVAPAPVTTETPVYTPAVVATTSLAAAATTASSSSSGSQKTYTGQITYYDVGLGSCGQTNTDSEFVVAMAVGMMDKSTMCGKTVTINYQGSSHQATVVDTCMSCVPGDLDMSPALFKAVAPNGDGRVSGVSWYFN